jgi:hypothetical protein
MIPKKKSFNVMALRGIQMDDMEVVKQYNLNPSLAYTNDINPAVLDIVYGKNVEELQKYKGFSLEKARSEAGKLRAQASKQIKELLA